MPSRKTTSSKTTDLANGLAAVGLRSTARAIDDLLAQAIGQQWSPSDLLTDVVRRELHDKAERSLARRLAQSRIGRFRPIADFDWGWPDQIDRTLVERALGLDFVAQGHNLILMGPNGVGKTMIAKNLAHTAALAGYSVLFRTAVEMIEDLSCDSPDLRRRRLRKYTQPALLAIDEVGYLSFDDHAADLLYAAFNPRYQNDRSTIITTNLAFRDWNIVFPNATCIVTLVDRLTHRAEILEIKGKSYRAREAQHRRQTPKEKHP